VSKKNDELTGFEHRFNFVARKPAGYSFRYPSRPVQPVNLVLSHVGTFPGSAGDAGKIYPGTLTGAAGLLASSGISFHPGKLG
jgi:hypothetical protein